MLFALIGHVKTTRFTGGHYYNSNQEIQKFSLNNQLNEILNYENNINKILNCQLKLAIFLLHFFNLFLTNFLKNKICDYW